MEPAALRGGGRLRPAPRPPVGQRWADLPPLLLPLVPPTGSAMPRKEKGFPRFRGARRPCLGVAFRPFCYPGRGTGFCFRSRDLGWGRFRLSGPGNSRRCHGTRHLLRGAASRGTRHGVRGIPSRTTRRADLGALQLWPPALPRPARFPFGSIK